jgi:hypothetical protein
MTFFLSNKAGFRLLVVNLLTEHPQTTAHDEQNARQDHENAAAAAARPGTVLSLGTVEAATAK